MLETYFSTARTVIANNYSVDNLVGILASEAGRRDVWHNTLINNGRSIVIQKGNRTGDEVSYTEFNNEYSQDSGSSTMSSIRDESTAGTTDFTAFQVDSGYNVFDLPATGHPVCRYDRDPASDLQDGSVNECIWNSTVAGDQQEWQSAEVVGASNPKDPVPSKTGTTTPTNVAAAMGVSVGQYHVGALFG